MAWVATIPIERSPRVSMSEVKASAKLDARPDDALTVLGAGVTPIQRHARPQFEVLDACVKQLGNQ
jgi:hypothetical protein